MCLSQHLFTADSQTNYMRQEQCHCAKGHITGHVTVYFTFCPFHQVWGVSAVATEELGTVVVDFSLGIQQAGVWSGWGWVLELSGMSIWRLLLPLSLTRTTYTTRPWARRNSSPASWRQNLQRSTSWRTWRSPSLSPAWWCPSPTWQIRSWSSWLAGPKRSLVR